MKNSIRIIFSFALVFGAVALISVFVSSVNAAWYNSLLKPAFTPPDSVFVPIGLILYVLMAFSLARVWILKETSAWRMWFFAFGAQLLFNMLWTVLFLSLHSLLLSSIDALVLWFCVLILTLDSWEIDMFTFWLLLPYLAWSTFALLLNVALWWIN